MALSYWYEGAHSITFTDSTGVSKNTWADWYLIPLSRPMIAQPGVTTNFVSIPGRRDPIDLTNYLTGKPVYGQRSGSWDFALTDDHYARLVDMLYTIKTFLHGKKLKVTLDDIPARYYEGEFSISAWQHSENYPTITINYTLEPFAYTTKFDPTTGDWLWDPFNFETDYTNGGERSDIL